MWTLIAGILIGALAVGCLVVFVLMLRSWGERHSGDGKLYGEIPADLRADIRWYFGKYVDDHGVTRNFGVGQAASIKRRLEEGE
jgi:hypothetical protein